MALVTIDPITRIEGHLKLQVDVSNGSVANAWSSGTLFRGIERILVGRKPEDAWLFTQRVCGVCTYVHGVCSVRSVEHATQTTIYDNARVVRNLLMGTQYLHDHVVHFYHLCLLDWVDVVSALAASPVATLTLATTLSPNAPAIDFAAVQARLRTLVESGKLGIFANGYWGHPAYRLSPEANLLFIAHYLDALVKQNLGGRMHAIWGAKNPHLQSLRVGGVTCERELTSTRVSEFRSLLAELKSFIDTVYVPDVVYLSQQYSSWFSVGKSNHFLCFGEFPETQSEPGSFFVPRGLIVDRDYANVRSVDVSMITEHVAHSWYEGTAALAPAVGVTNPAYSTYDQANRYSWLKAPRYNGLAMEVGPLARVLIGYGQGQSPMVASVNEFLARSGLNLDALNSTMGRILARAIETQTIADRMATTWINALSTTAVAYRSVSTAVTARGVGLNEAPRGALGHWSDIAGGQLANYQMVVPSTWNFGPRCAANLPGPVENALVGTPIADVSQPIEVLRTVHSFDPCIACAVHVADGDQSATVDVQTR